MYYYEVSLDYWLSFYYFSSEQLDQIGTNLLGTTWKGVYPLDKIPHVRDGSIIVNTHSSHLGGEHWIAVRIRPNGIKVFDPLGYFYPPMLVNALARMMKPISYNRIQYQNPETRLCGHYCIMWLSSENV